ncbi:MAG: 4-hydroxyphenylacetate 3-hydroxylase C-terminal domain-containing protein [Anaerolineae bacterium]
MPNIGMCWIAARRNVWLWPLSVMAAFSATIWLDAARNLYPHLYPRMVEIIQQLGASGLVAAPTEADVNGPMRAEIQRFFQAARADALERIPIFRLAWDTAVSAFASRQALYERYFFGDPVRMAGVLVRSHDMTPYMDIVRDFLKRTQEEA